MIPMAGYMMPLRYWVFDALTLIMGMVVGGMLGVVARVKTSVKNVQHEMNNI